MSDQTRSNQTGSDRPKKGYLIAHLDVRNPTLYGDYVARAPEIAKGFGGTYLLRGGESETREGDLPDRDLPDRHVIIEFPSYTAAKAFYDSAQYAEIIDIRKDNTHTTLVLAEGV